MVLRIPPQSIQNDTEQWGRISWRGLYHFEGYSGHDLSKIGVTNGSAQNALWGIFHNGKQKMAYLATNGS